MENLKTLDYQLYYAFHGNLSPREIQTLWNEIKSKKEILQEACEVVENKWHEKTLKSNLIADTILDDYEHVDQEVYQQLVNTVYQYQDIARCVADRERTESSLLVKTLWNPQLRLTDKQKEFALKEAMEAKRIQIHGSSTFDIHYQILRNPNWSIWEKQKLVMDFWDKDEDYDERLEDWEWDVTNDRANYQGNNFPPFDKYELFNVYTYDMLSKIHQDKATTDRIWEEMEFCKLMHILRPQQWEKEVTPQVAPQKVKVGNLD